MEEREHADLSHNTSPLSCCHHSHLNSTLTALNGPFMYLKGSSVNPCLEFTLCDALCGSEFSNISVLNPQAHFKCRTVCCQLSFSILHGLFRYSD
ncbi:hypothetical protein PO909_022619 [Leuciscus waleckii]